jgi:hydrogenase expression/formation protein HypC
LRAVCLGVPGQILDITGTDPYTRLARVSFAGVVRDVCLAGVPDASVGDYVIVHAGFALSRVDRAEADEVFGYLARISELGRVECPQDQPGGADDEVR